MASVFTNEGQIAKKVSGEGTGDGWSIIAVVDISKDENQSRTDAYADAPPPSQCRLPSFSRGQSIYYFVVYSVWDVFLDLGITVKQKNAVEFQR